jgi:hypothetical protein
MGGGGGQSGHISWVAYLEHEHKWGFSQLRPILLELLKKGAPNRFHADPAAFFGKENDTGTSAIGLLRSILDLDSDSLVEDNMKEYNPLPAEYTAWRKRFVDTYDAWAQASQLGQVANLVDAVEVRSRDRLQTTIIPQFEQGMRDINASYNFAFVIAKGELWKDHAREMDELEANLRYQHLQNTQNQRMQLVMTGIGQEHIQLGFTTLQAEVALKKAALKIQQKEAVVKIADGVFSDAANFAMKYAAVQTENAIFGTRWKAETMRYWEEMMASISGAVPIRPGEDMSTTRSAIAGAAGGAAASFASGGNPWMGALLGGFAGAVGG